MEDANLAVDLASLFPSFSLERRYSANAATATSGRASSAVEFFTDLPRNEAMARELTAELSIRHRLATRTLRNRASA